MEAGDIRSIAFEAIDERFSRGKYLGVEVTIDMTNGYINGPHLVGQAKTRNGEPKHFPHWRKAKLAKDIIDFISQNEGINTCDLIRDVMDVRSGLRGAYVHPFLVPHIASWASPRLAHIIGRIMNAVACGLACGLEPPAKLYTDPRIEPKVGCVYFISNGVNTKIGWTFDLPKRLSSLQTSNDRDLIVIKTILCFNPENIESSLHQRFEDKLVRGEWFDLSLEDIEAVEI